MQKNYATQASLQLLEQKVEVLECNLKSFDRKTAILKNTNIKTNK